MPLTANRPDWDIFCTVVDNFGDIGVCWRLARQLASEHALQVRLWVDDLHAFHILCPQVDVQLSAQQVQGVEIRLWPPVFADTVPADVVVEAFACHIPESFIATMAQRTRPPVWINLEYLSAEEWVNGCHGLTSPHPRLALIKYFFFPGFTQRTGGLLRERDLLSRRDAFQDSAQTRAVFWKSLNSPAPSADMLLVSLFAYENPAIVQLLQLWANGTTAICCYVPVSRSLPLVAGYCGETLRAGDSCQRGALTIRVLPFLAQQQYDALLWVCDLNFVRGEDSFVRAQWAARPLIWHIYPQEDAAHLVKLDAFLALYGATLPATARCVLRDFMHAWNAGYCSAALWGNLLDTLPTLRRHAGSWAARLALQEDLAGALACFVRSKL